MIRKLIQLSVLAIIMAPTLVASLPGDDCAPTWDASQNPNEWATQMRECSFNEQNITYVDVSKNDVPEFSGVAASLGGLGSVWAYLLLRKRK